MCLRYSIVKRNKKERKKNDVNKSGLKISTKKKQHSFTNIYTYPYTHGKHELRVRERNVYEWYSFGRQR